MVTEDEGVHYSNSTPIPIADSDTVLVGTRVNKADTLAGDVYMWDKTNNTNFWMRPAKFTDNKGKSIFPSSRFEPIAVVAIPASHNVYGTNEVGMVSLNYMSTTDPENGGDAQGIRWGGYGTDLEDLTNLRQVPVYSKTSSTTLTPNYIGYSPSDMFSSYSLTGENVSADEDAKYSESINLIPSPYTQNGGRNELYYTTRIDDTDIPNACADFDGKGNTDVIIAATTADWSGNTIANLPGVGNYPAACCCRRYHKGNTIAGDWYLPAAGEGGYLMARFKRINQALTKLQVFDTSCVLVRTDNHHWLSTEDSSYSARYMEASYGYNVSNDKNFGLYVRGWLRA